MKPKSRSLISAFAPFRHTSIIVCASICAATSAHADQTWIGAIDSFWTEAGNWSAAVPSASENAVFDASSAANLSIDTVANQAVGGIVVGSPAGPITIGNNTLTLGAGGIDMSAATQGLTLDCNVSLLGATTQDWTIGAGASLTLAGTLGQAAGGALVDIDTSTGGLVILPIGTPSTMLGTYVTHNKSDFAALDEANFVVAGNTVTTYSANPDTGAALPSTSTSFTYMDVINSNTNAISAFRLSGNTTMGGGGVRFATPHANSQNWVVDINTRALYTKDESHILVASNIDTDVVFNPSGLGLRSDTSGTTDVYVTNFSAQDLIFRCAFSQSSGRNFRVTRSGSGDVFFSGDVTASAGYLLNEGITYVGEDGTSGSLSGGGIQIASGATLALNRSDATYTLGSVISGGGAVAHVGSGVITLSGANTYTGGTNVTGGLIGASSIGNFGTGGINLNGGGIRFATPFDVTASSVEIGSSGATFDTNGNNVTFSNAFAPGSTGSVTKSGGGTLTLTATNDYSGGTIVNGGTLFISGTSATGSGAVTFNSGTTLSGTGSIAGAVDLASGASLIPGASVGTLTVGGLNLQAGTTATFEFSSTPANDQIVVSTSGGLTIDGGLISVVEEGTSTPFTTVGTYNLFAYSGSIGGAGVSALSVDNPQPGYSYTFGSDGSFVTLTIAFSGVLTDWTLDGDGSWSDAGNWGGTIPNETGATANFNVNLTAPATVTLDGSRIVGAITFLSAANGYTIAQGSGGSLIFDNGGSDSSILDGAGVHTISAPVTLTSNVVVNTTAEADSVTLSGVVSGAGSLTKTGPGILALLGVNDFTGDVTLAGGLIEFAGTGSLGSGTLFFDGGGLRWATGNTVDPSTLVTDFLAGGAIFDTNGNDIGVAGNVGGTGSGRLTKQGAGTMTLASGQTFEGGVSVLGGTLSIEDVTALGTSPLAPTPGRLIIDNGTLETTSPMTFDANLGITLGGAATMSIPVSTDSVTINGIIDGTGSLSLQGGGTWYLNAVNTYSGGTLISGGTLHQGADAITGTGLITLDGATLVTDGSDSIYNDLPNNVDVPAGKTSSLMLSGRVEVGGTYTGAVDSTLNVGVNFVRDNINGNWSGFNGQINVTGSGEFRINNGNGFGNARLNLGDGVYMHQVFNPPSGSGTQTVQNIGELSGTAGAILGGNPVGGRFVNWTIGALNTDSTFAGVIQNDTDASNGFGEPIITKVGTGTLTLSNVNTYTGPTRVLGGTLALDASGSIDNSTALTVGAAGVLDVTAKTTFAIPATQTVTFNLDGLNAGASGRIDATGQELDITNAVVNFTIGDPLDDAVYVLADYGTLTGGAFASVTLPDGYAINYAYNGGTQIALILETGSAYDTWAGGFSLIGGPGDDDDLDGIANGIEFVIGGDPTTATEGGKMPTLTRSGGAMVFVFRRTSESASLNPSVQHGSDFASPWTTAADGVDGVTIVEETDGFETGVDKVTVTIPTADAKHFARLNVVAP